MANDYPALIRVLEETGFLADGDVFTTTLDPTTYVNLTQANAIQFAATGPSGPLTSGNLRLLNWTSSNILNATQANAILTNFGAALAPPAGLKITFQYNVGIQGYSEIFYYNGNVPSDITLTSLNFVINGRLNWSGRQTFFKRVKVTQNNSRFATAVYTAAQCQAAGLATVQGVWSDGATFQPTDAPDTCLITNWTSGSRSRRMFLRGIPDVVVANGGQFTNVGTFLANFQSWVNNLIAAPPWGWYGQPGGGNTRVNITALTNANGQLTFTLAAPGLFGALVGQNVAVRIRGCPHPFAFMNGPMVVQPSSATVATSIRSFPFPPGAAFSSTSAQMYLQTPGTYYPFTSAGIEGVGERKAGRPFGLARGRQRNRVWS